MIQPPSPATRGQAGGRRCRGSGCQQPGWGVQRGLPGLTQAAHLLPCSWGRGRGSPSSREGSGGNSSPAPAPSLPSHRLLRQNRQTLSRWLWKVPRSQLLSRSLPVGAAWKNDAEVGEGQADRHCLLQGAPALLRKLEGILYHTVMS